jgi:hypothetical protein
MEIVRVTPSLPQRGTQHEGASPLDSHERLEFSFPLPEYDPQLCSTGASPNEAVSAHSTIAIRCLSPFLVF